MIVVEGYKAFSGEMKWHPPKREPEIIAGDWLYKPDADCWYCRGRSYLASVCTVYSDDADTLKNELLNRGEQLDKLPLVVGQVVYKALRFGYAAKMTVEHADVWDDSITFYAKGDPESYAFETEDIGQTVFVSRADLARKWGF